MNNPETQATRYRTKINKTSKAAKNTIQKRKIWAARTPTNLGV